MTHILLLLVCATQAYDHGDSTSDEQLVLEIINRARVNAAAEATRLAITPNIDEGFPVGFVRPSPQPPLAMNPLLLSAARAHSRDMWTRSFFAHTNPSGTTFDQRLTNAGYAWTSAAENIAVSSNPATTAATLEDNLMIDSGVTDRGHRMNLLDVYVPPPIPPVRREIGIGHYSNSVTNGQPWRSFLTQDFGRSSAGPFLVGMVHRDTIVANTFYDIGEGLPGVTITITGGGTTVTAPGGGFALPCPTSGTVTVVASGGPLNTTLNLPATFGAQNVYLAFRPTAGQILDTDGDGLPDSYETAHGLNINFNDAAGDADSDTYSNLVEYQRGTNPGSAASFPGSGTGSALAPVAPPPAPAGGTSSGGGGGGCGALGAEALLLLLLLRRR